MSTVDTAPTAAPLELMDGNAALFMMQEEKAPAVVTVPGSSNFDLALFNIIATGTVKASVPGSVVLTLYGMAKGSVDEGSMDPATWLPLGSAPAEPIGGAGELPVTMWMIAGIDLMIFTGSGKMQGLFKSNVAASPKAPVDLTHHPGDIKATDPLYIFTVGASFTPTATKSKAAGDVLCTLTLESLTMDA